MGEFDFLDWYRSCGAVRRSGGGKRLERLPLPRAGRLMCFSGI
jgi:hypothetical protein